MYTRTESLLSCIAGVSLFTTHFLFSSPLCSVFLLHHVNYFYPQRDFLCFKGVRAVEQERQQRQKQCRTQRRRKKSIDLQRKGRVWSASLAYMMNGREIGKPALNILLLFNLSACFLLSLSFFFFYYCSFLNKGLFLSFSVLVPKHHIQ